VDNIKATGVLFLVGDDSNTTQIATTSDHSQISNIELDKVNNLASGNVDLDSVVDLDEGIRVSDSSGVVESDDGDSLGAKDGSLDLAELVLSFFRGDSLDGKSALGVVQETEGLVGLLNRNHIHETSREGGVGSDLTVNLDESLHDDGGDLLSSKSVLESVSQQDDQGKTLSQFVGAWGGSGSKDSRQFVEHPVLGCCKAFKMLLGSTSHDSGLYDDQQQVSTQHDRVSQDYPDLPAKEKNSLALSV